MARRAEARMADQSIRGYFETKPIPALPWKGSCRCPSKAVSKAGSRSLDRADRPSPDRALLAAKAKGKNNAEFASLKFLGPAVSGGTLACNTMIRLSATQLDAYGHLRFTIEVDGATHLTTDEALQAAKALAELGVDRPLQRVEHVRTWGVVEIEAASEG
jgi:hypothetical protein